MNENLAGKKVRCPGCQSIVPVPGPSEKAPATPPPPRPTAAAAPGGPPANPPVLRRQVVLRSIVLVLAFLGGGVAGYLGFQAFTNVHDPKQRASLELQRALLQEADKVGATGSHVQNLREEVDRFDRLGYMCYVMLAAGLLGFAGGVLAFLRRRRLAAPMLLVPPAVAGAIYAQSLFLTAPLILGGLLSLLIRPWPRVDPA